MTARPLAPSTAPFWRAAASVAIWIGGWSVVARLSRDEVIGVPSPAAVLVAFQAMLLDGTLGSAMAVSVGRVATGFTLALALGVPLGFWSALSRTGAVLVGPASSFLRYVPPSAFTSILILYFGIGERFKYAVVFAGVIFFVVQMTADVAVGVDARHVLAARAAGFSPWQLFVDVTLPYSLPRLVDVVRINLSAAWTFLVLAELVGADGGLGYLLAQSQRFLRVPNLYAGVLAFGFIGLALDWVIGFARHLVFPWYERERARGR